MSIGEGGFPLALAACIFASILLLGLATERAMSPAVEGMPSTSMAATASGAPAAMILTGIPPWRQAEWTESDGEVVPIGCGPEAARLLLSFYDLAFGYGRLVRTDPDAVVRELHERMGTLTVTWKRTRLGYTAPWLFGRGIEGFIAARYSGGATVERASGPLDEVFERSVALIRRRTPHVILFDWAGEGWLFPSHYAVVVGYSTTGGARDLVVNTGWGYDFQILDMHDPIVWPATLYWIARIDDRPDGAPTTGIGPPSAEGMWRADATGRPQLAPIVRPHFDPTQTASWRASDATVLLVASPEGRVGESFWYDAPLPSAASP